MVIRESAPVSASVAIIAAAPHDAEMNTLEERARERAGKYPRAEPLADDAVVLVCAEREDALRCSSK